MSEKDNDKKKNESGFFDLREVGKYYFRKKDSKKKDINLRMMHGINKIALFMFLAAIIYLIIKRLFIY